jgi:twitching motility protein PilT
MDFDSIFKTLVEQQASDLYLKGGTKPAIRFRGRVTPLGEQELTKTDMLQLADELMGPDQQQQLHAERELNFAFEREGYGRFRANVLWQQGSLSMVIRRVQRRIPSFEELNLPAEVLKRLAAERQGLILVTGPTASGKSTTVSSLLNYINDTMAAHIVTLEDPIEYIFEERKAIINQREVGTDTKSFSEGLKNVLRQSPDIMYLSDLRDLETIEAALLAAESGQLVLSCVHTTNALTTVERLIAFFPPQQHDLTRFRLSLVLKGIVSLRLLPRKDGKGQVPVYEVLVMTPTIRQLIQEHRVEEIPSLMENDTLHGMNTQTQCLHRLVSSGMVAIEEALRIADKPNELQLMLRDIRATKDVL